MIDSPSTRVGSTRRSEHATSRRALKKQLRNVRCLCGPSEWAACRATGARCGLRS